MMVAANLYVIRNTEDNKSFLCHTQLNYDITAVLQIRVNTYVNPAELETTEGVPTCLKLESTH